MKATAEGILAGNLRSLAKAITLVESRLPDHRAEARALLSRLRRSGRQALRLGLTGTPGSGKSTFIERFGLMLADQGQRVAVLAVDPSSALSGGSILGDKTRMENLSRHPNAFIRPSPSQSAVGGVSQRTRDAVGLCEAAGFDIVIIETVGVGQTETQVEQMSDIFILLLAPAGGDALQGVKRGVIEIADLVLVNKCDGDLASNARLAAAEYSAALKLFRKRDRDPEGFPKTMLVSARDGTGLEACLREIQALAMWRRDSGHWTDNRARQAVSWFESEVDAGMLAGLEEISGIAKLRMDLADRVGEGAVDPDEAAQQLLAGFRTYIESRARASALETDVSGIQTPGIRGRK